MFLMSTTFRVIAATIGWFALGLQYWLLMTGDIGPGPLGRTVNFFSYFTILINIMAALALTLPWLAPRSAAGRFFGAPTVRTGIATYIIVVGTTYFLILRHLWAPQGWAFVADASLHYLMPVLFVLDWLLFVPKGTLRFKDALAWIPFPLAYMLWTFVYGALSGFYPYPFVDVSKLGYGRVTANALGLFAGFLALGLVMIAIDRFWGRARKA
jgi:hypothetical protein